MRAIISILLSIVITATGTAFSPARQAPQTGGTALTAPAVVHGDVDWKDMAYTHYEPAWFYDQVDELTALAQGDDGQAVIDLYDILYDEMVRIYTLSSIAYIRYSNDVTDEYWSAESIYCDTLSAEAADALSTACHAVTEGPCADSFRAHVGDNAAAQFAGYVPLTDEEVELIAREAELVDAYYAIMANAGEAEYVYLGESWTWDMVDGFQGTGLAYRDYDGYLAVYYGLLKVLNDQVGPIFTELVQIRAEIAGLEGYDNYADLAYEQVYGRDYTGEDAQLLCDAVKPIARAYYNDLYYSPLWSDSDGVMPVMDSGELVETLGRYASRLDPMLTEPWEYMAEHGLYGLDAGDGRMDGAYTIDLPRYGASFIFASLSDSCGDMETLSHEFGHFVHDYYHPAPNVLSSVGSYDLMEIHSTGLEVLFSAFYDEIFDEGAPIARFNVLGGVMESILDGCIYDEFQRRVYAQPDMTLNEINKLYAEICSRYGKYEPMGVDYAWMFVLHNYESPLYYISYAVSALAAAQIWDMAQEDLQSAVDAWKAVLDRSAYDEGYMAVLPACGLRLFTEEGAVDQICEPLLKELTRLNAEA